MDFEGSNGAAVGFGVSPAVWRRRDIEALYSLAAKTEYASSARYELKPNGRVKEFMIDPRHAYPVLLDGESGQTVGHCKAGGSKSDYWIEPDFDPGFPHKEIGFFAILHTDEAGLRHLKEVVLVTPTGSAGDDERRFALPSIARDPDPDHYDLELGRFKESFQLDTDITCAVRLGSASGPRLGECRVGDLSGDAWVEPHFTLPVPRDEARFYAAWNIDSDGLRHLTEVILATKGAKPPSVKPVGRELGDTETGWMLMFSIVGFIELIIGSAIAIGQNGRNWPANVGAGALGYVVFSAYSFLATRVPMKPALLRLVPTVSMAVAIALPVAIWVVVNGLPCPPKCA